MDMSEYVLKIKAEMEGLLGCPIEIVDDADVAYPCKMEFARNYGRDRHVVRVNPSRCSNAFPIFSMMLQAKLQLAKLPSGQYGVMQPVSGPEEGERFEADFRNDRVGKILCAKLGASQIDNLLKTLQGGIVTQTCNQVLEMLVADVVVKDYPEAVEDMKAYLRHAALEGAAVSYEELLAIYPEFIVTTNRLLNLFFAMKCGEICGEKLIDAYKPKSDEIDNALDLYSFYRKERDSLAASGQIAGDVVRNFLKQLKVDRYAHLIVAEISPSGEVPKCEDDGLTEAQRASLKDFYEHHGDGKSDSSLMVLGMFKVLRDLKRVPLEVVKSLAIEIAMLGQNGISATKKYTLKNLPNRGEIWGAEVLAYYYVTWAKVFPEKLDILGLPYKEAYASAVKMLEEFERH